MLQDYRQSKMEEMRSQMQSEIQERVDQLKANPKNDDQAQGPFVPLLRCRVVDLMAPSFDDSSPIAATLTFWRPSEDIKSLMREVVEDIFLTY